MRGVLGLKLCHYDYEYTRVRTILELLFLRLQHNSPPYRAPEYMHMSVST
jgi:hypothetical protein